MRKIDQLCFLVNFIHILSLFGFSLKQERDPTMIKYYSNVILVDLSHCFPTVGLKTNHHA
jgi:hypothetical protein